MACNRVLIGAIASALFAGCGGAGKKVTCGPVPSFASPAVSCLAVAEPKTLPTVLAREQVQKVLATVREPRFAVCLRLIYYCGLRISEAVSLAVGIGGP